mmetsp:Transcript_33727/g.93156  ORF Transcript_33727/g.93156 Transcript_33727/m.93156 type:complete len:233 (-) Transcript_33727:774-1472(-)
MALPFPPPLLQRMYGALGGASGAANVPDGRLRLPPWRARPRGFARERRPPRGVPRREARRRFVGLTGGCGVAGRRFQMSGRRVRFGGRPRPWRGAEKARLPLRRAARMHWMWRRAVPLPRHLRIGAAVAGAVAGVAPGRPRGVPGPAAQGRAGGHGAAAGAAGGAGPPGGARARRDMEGGKLQGMPEVPLFGGEDRRLQHHGLRAEHARREPAAWVRPSLQLADGEALQGQT